MHIMFVASEVAPYSKTGGLADVCGALPKELAKLGCKTSIVTPLYKCARDYFQHSTDRLNTTFETLSIPIGSEVKRAGVQTAKITAHCFLQLFDGFLFCRQNLLRT